MNDSSPPRRILRHAQHERWAPPWRARNDRCARPKTGLADAVVAAWLGLVFGKLGDAHFLDAPAGDAEDFEADAVDADVVADAGNAAEFVDDEAADAVEVVLLDRHVEHLA